MKQVQLTTHIIHFVGGTKRTILNVIDVWENEFTHLIDINGTEWIVNKNNVLLVERITVEENGPINDNKS